MRRPLIYLGIVVAIAVAVFLIERPDLIRRGDVSDDPVFPEYDAKRITRMEVEQLLSGVALKRSADGWNVSSLMTPLQKELMDKEGKEIPGEDDRWYKADRTGVGVALGVFGDLWRGIVVSTNPDRQALYHVNDALGLHVRLFEGDRKVVDIVVGKQSPDFGSNYIRVADSNDVMLTDRVISEQFPVTVADWRDHTIWRVDPAKVKGVEISHPKGSFEIEKDGGGWKVEGQGEAELDVEKVDRFISRVVFLRASGFASDGDPKSKFKRAGMALGLELEDGGELEIEFGGSNNLGQTYARVKDDNQIYLLKNVDSIVPKGWKDFQKK
jgi:hypothetical protein